MLGPMGRNNRSSLTRRTPPILQRPLRPASIISGPMRSASVNVLDGRPRWVSYDVDLTGATLKRDESDGNTSAGDPHELWYRFAGKLVGYVGNNGTLETNETDSLANRTATQGAGAFRNGSTSSTSAAD